MSKLAQLGLLACRLSIFGTVVIRFEPIVSIDFGSDRIGGILRSYPIPRPGLTFLWRWVLCLFWNGLSNMGHKKILWPRTRFCQPCSYLVAWKYNRRPRRPHQCPIWCYWDRYIDSDPSQYTNIPSLKSAMSNKSHDLGRVWRWPSVSLISEGCLIEI